MNKDYHPQIKSILQKNPVLSNFDTYYLGFFSYLTPQIVLDDIFGFIKNIVELRRDELLTNEEKLKSFVRMMSRKMDSANLASLVPEDWENPDPKTFLIEFFTKMSEIIPKYENITKEQIFFLGYFQAACPTYGANEIFVQIDNVNEALGDNFQDEEAHLDFLLKILVKKIDENRNNKGSLRIPGREGTQSTQANGQATHSSNGAHLNSVSNQNSQNGARKRRIEFNEDDEGKKMTKKAEPAENGERKALGGRRITMNDPEEDLEEIKDEGDPRLQQNGQRANPVRRGDSVSSNPFEDLLIEPREPKKTAPLKKDTSQFELTELPLEEFEGYNAQNFKKPGMKRMESAEEEALSKAYIEKLQQEEAKENEKHREKANKQGEANCAICLDDLYSTSFKPLEGCSHVFHEDCMKDYLKSKIDEKGFPIRCPELECKSEITIADVSDFLDQAYAEKFVSFSFKSYLEKNAGEVSCCPTADCGFAFIKEENQVDFKCPVCNKHYCLNCRVVWHKGETCKEYQISHTKDENDVKFEDFVKGQQFKQCPKCGFWVSRTEGCNAMVCRCQTQFCYNCGKEGDGHVCPCLTQNRPAAGLFGALAAGANAGLWGAGGLLGNANRNNNNLFANNNVNRPTLFANTNVARPVNWYNNNPVYNPPNLFANPPTIYNPPPVYNPPNLFNQPAYNPPLYRGGGLFGNLLNPYVNPPQIYNNAYDDDEDDEDYEEEEEGSDEDDDSSEEVVAAWRPVLPKKKKTTRRKKRN